MRSLGVLLSGQHAALVGDPSLDDQMWCSNYSNTCRALYAVYSSPRQLQLVPPRKAAQVLNGAVALLAQHTQALPSGLSPFARSTMPLEAANLASTLLVQRLILQLSQPSGKAAAPASAASILPEETAHLFLNAAPQLCRQG